MPKFNMFLIGFMRFFGVTLSIISTILFVQCIGVFFDTESTIKVNDVSTGNLSEKLGAVIFSLFSLDVGLFLLFSSVTRLESIFIPKFMRDKK